MKKITQKSLTLLKTVDWKGKPSVDALIDKIANLSKYKYNAFNSYSEAHKAVADYFSKEKNCRELNNKVNQLANKLYYFGVNDWKFSHGWKNYGIIHSKSFDTEEERDRACDDYVTKYNQSGRKKAFKIDKWQGAKKELSNRSIDNIVDQLARSIKQQ